MSSEAQNPWFKRRDKVLLPQQLKRRNLLMDFGIKPYWRCNRGIGITKKYECYA